MAPAPFHQWLGIEVETRENGHVVYHLEIEAVHKNGAGVVHGGVVAALLDSAMGSAVVTAIPAEWWCSTTSLAIQFLDGARGGRVTARGTVIRRGRRVAHVTGELVDADGRVVATAQGAWHLWPHRPGTPPPPSRYVVLRGTGERIPVGKIVAVGRNYSEHIREMGGAGDEPPVLFLKPATAVVHDGDVVLLPRDLGQVHHEVELVAVIGKPGRAIAESMALEHVLGFAVGLDLTLRDVQTEAKGRGEPWTTAKGFDGSAPVSLVAPRDEVGDGSGLAIEASVDGALRQRGSTSRMTRSVAAVVAHASRLMTLERGDLVFTGTPAGVGPVEPGSTVEARIERVGSLTIRCE
jgi:5-carboxymethyl-2-hydroxymuconate isomerase